MTVKLNIKKNNIKKINVKWVNKIIYKQINFVIKSIYKL